MILHQSDKYVIQLSTQIILLLDEKHPHWFKIGLSILLYAERYTTVVAIAWQTHIGELYLRKFLLSLIKMKGNVKNNHRRNLIISIPMPDVTQRYEITCQLLSSWESVRVWRRNKNTLLMIITLPRYLPRIGRLIYHRKSQVTKIRRNSFAASELIILSRDYIFCMHVSSRLLWTSFFFTTIKNNSNWESRIRSNVMIVKVFRMRFVF